MIWLFDIKIEIEVKILPLKVFSTLINFRKVRSLSACWFSDRVQEYSKKWKRFIWIRWKGGKIKEASAFSSYFRFYSNPPSVYLFFSLSPSNEAVIMILKIPKLIAYWWRQILNVILHCADHWYILWNIEDLEKIHGGNRISLMFFYN